MPIPLISYIEPQNGGLFPVYRDTDGYGGFQVRQNITDRNSIPALNRKTGMMVFTVTEQTFWQLESDLVTWQQAIFAPNFSFAGDLSGDDFSQIVTGLQGHHVSNVAPTDGYVLTWDQVDGYWKPLSIANNPNIPSFDGIPSNEYGGAGNKIPIPATETILGSSSTYPASSASNGITTTDNAWHTILTRQPLGPGRWQVTIVGQDGYGNEFSGHLDFHVNTSSITPGVPQIINPFATGTGGNYTIQAIFSGGKVVIQVMNASGSNPVKWGAWMQDMTRL